MIIRVAMISINYNFYLPGAVDSVDTELVITYMFYPITSKKPKKLLRKAVALIIFHFKAH